jgi:hypothetical protein
MPIRSPDVVHTAPRLGVSSVQPDFQQNESKRKSAAGGVCDPRLRVSMPLIILTTVSSPLSTQWASEDRSEGCQTDQGQRGVSEPER